MSRHLAARTGLMEMAFRISVAYDY